MPQSWLGPSLGDYRVWVYTCALAELAGIGGAAGWWIAMDRIAPDPMSLAGKLTMLGAKSLSGLVEGTILGFLQARVLRRFYPRLTIGLWVSLTALPALIGWAFGSAIPIFAAPDGNASPEPPLGLVIVLSAVMGLFVGALFGGMQALALKSAARRTHWWAIANAAGWAVALPVIYAAASIPGETWMLWQIIAVGLASGAMAGLILGAVTGLAFWRMNPL